MRSTRSSKMTDSSDPVVTARAKLAAYHAMWKSVSFDERLPLNPEELLGSMPDVYQRNFSSA